MVFKLDASRVGECYRFEWLSLHVSGDLSLFYRSRLGADKIRIICTDSGQWLP